ncbi:putative proton-coupled zinc antiporter SLC30A3 isoform X2 [Pelodiscus sinensis]|uniref:putative proton-coupled zinc antiporter SLC30A3 isoform X2 n=1 Tax=Pelodiscus sinensis TaxID=13735 RepID=UPI003F6C3BEE
MDPPSGTGDPESARLVSVRGSCSTGTRRLKSLFAGSQKPFPDLPLETSPAAPTLELQQHLTRHCHRGPPTPSQSRAELQACQKLGTACAICFVFMVGEVIGGYLAHSLAIMTDAAHLLADVGSMSVSLFSLWVSARPATKTMSFGWHRSETLGALASVLSIWVVTGVLVYLASARIISDNYEIDARAMLATSACAVGVNIIMAYILHQTSVGHGHGRGYEKMESPGCCKPPRGPLPGSTSVRAAFVHVVGDLLQSLGVLTAAIIIYVEPRYKIADPISTFLFSIFVLGSTLTILRDVFRVLMEGTPRGLEFSAVKDVLLAVKGVKGAHNLHLWALTLSHHVVSVHLAVGECSHPPDHLSCQRDTSCGASCPNQNGGSAFHPTRDMAPACSAPQCMVPAGPTPQFLVPAGAIPKSCSQGLGCPLCLQMPVWTWRQCCRKPPTSCRAPLASSHARCRWSGTWRTWQLAASARTLGTERWECSHTTALGARHSSSQPLFCLASPHGQPAGCGAASCSPGLCSPTANRAQCTLCQKPHPS